MALRLFTQSRNFKDNLPEVDKQKIKLYEKFIQTRYIYSEISPDDPDIMSLYEVLFGENKENDKKWNEKINLTSITDRDQVYLKHFYDSISMAFYVDFTKQQSICDVGAGAGFPSIPLKICFPDDLI